MFENSWVGHMVVEGNALAFKGAEPATYWLHENPWTQLPTLHINLQQSGEVLFFYSTNQSAQVRVL